jgi:hypothetical protein
VAKMIGHASKPPGLVSKQQQMVQLAILSLVVKTMDKYVLSALDLCVMTNVPFDLWMSTSRHNTFVLVINFINL